MAENQGSLQGELFTHSADDGQYKPQIRRNPFFMRFRGYEKALLLIMGMVLVGIVAFSFGVENGKHLVLTAKKGELVNYTIQIAAFKNRELAAREVQLLSRKGLTPLAFAKGNYIILCVGKFSNQESAQPLLTVLQRTYAGCRIRRL
ncbi:MAG: SPOR domain-containing protein [Candidatus Omnitrophica bacterium]|nr:SPOR domain-containing protein [Candidatus Omnitrophota bacterium]